MLRTLSACILAASLAAACNPANQPSTSGEAPAADTPAPEQAALTPAGEPTPVAPEEARDTIQWAASVVRVDYLRNQQDGGSKLFGTAGGDPAMNGLYTHIAFFGGPAEGWRVFRLGDFLDYRVLSEAPGRVDLELQESTIDSDGVIDAQTRRIIVRWEIGEHGAPPQSVSVTPAA